MEKTREEVSNEFKWDLSVVYKNEDELTKDYEETKKRIANFKKYEDNFLDSSSNLYNALKESFGIEMILDKMWTYTMNKYNEDISNSENQAWKEKVYDLFDKYTVNSSFFIPKLLSFGSSKINEYLEENEDLKKDYDFILENVFRSENHTLSLEEEKLMSSLSKAFSDTSKVSEMLNDSDLDFGFITDEDGNKVKLTDTNYSVYIMSKDRRVRKEAFETFYKVYKQFNNTFSLLLASYVSKNRAISKVRKFNSSLEASLFNDNISIDVYNNLIDVVNKNLDAVYEYYKVKKEALGLDEMHLYDTYAEICNESDKKYTFEEAKELVIDSLKILGEDYITNLKKAFDEKWIDIYPNKGKKGGAYSAGGYLTNPFVLLNFKGLYHDVSTLAHELGHSMHSYYSNLNQPYQYSDYQIFVAEVASQVNELLFSKYMLDKVETKEEKINILNQTLELFKASIVRQTMFAEFERDIASLEQDEVILTSDVLNDKYYSLVKKYFGDGLVIDDEIKYEWQGIPHFYYNFYVYKYSTGLAAACYIVSNILEGKEGALENYLEFLKTGGSDYPLNELLVAGVDLTKPEVIQSAMNMFKENVLKIKDLLK